MFFAREIMKIHLMVYRLMSEDWSFLPNECNSWEANILVT